MGDATKGAALWTMQACVICHGDNAAGLYGPNITMSKTAGIGIWTEAQFRDAVRLGKNIDGSDLCTQMTRFPVSDINDAAIADLFAYLKTKPISDVAMRGSYCP